MIAYKGKEIKSGWYRGKKMKEAWMNGHKVWPKEEESFDGMVLNITTPSNNFVLNLFDYVGESVEDNAIIDWNDGSEIVTINSKTSSLSHTYTTAGNYQLKISGQIRWKGKYQNSATSSLSKCLTSIELPTNNSPIVGVGGSDARCAFNSFTKLTTIPEGLFSNCTAASSFVSCFEYCISLQFIPENLFNNKPGGVESIEHAFRSCNKLQSIPENLFANCPNLSNVNFAFYACRNLQSIPENLFANCPNLGGASSTFENCTSLQFIPGNLFANCSQAKFFQTTFNGCTGLSFIPEGLFDDCINAISFESAFEECSNIQTIPENLFNNCTNASNFSGAFMYCSSITSKLPELWISHPKASHNSCFYNCTKAPNYQAAKNAGWA